VRAGEWAETRLLVVSLRSGAGLDGLQEAAHVAVFGELDWSPGMHDQCIGRLHRDGQDEAVVAYFLVSDQGADPVMAEVLNLKRQQSEPIRDPDAELFEQAEDTRDRVRRLATDLLKRQKQTHLAA
jgi:SNF2 family DNA or RNA helicase